MKERILLVGEDSNLTATRALLLSDWETESLNSVSALERVEMVSFDLIIICHSVSGASAKKLIRTAQMSTIPPAVLLIRDDGSGEKFGVDVHPLDLWESPAWLRERVSELLGAESGSEQQGSMTGPARAANSVRSPHSSTASN